MTLWQIITGNSSLPVQAGTTFWDHLTNQQGGSSGPCGGYTQNAEYTAPQSIDNISAQLDSDVVMPSLTVDTLNANTANIIQTSQEADIQCSQ